MQKIPEDKLNSILERFATIEKELSSMAGGGDRYVKLTREYAQLTPTIRTIEKYLQTCKELEEIEGLLSDLDTDPEDDTDIETKIEEALNAGVELLRLTQVIK